MNNIKKNTTYKATTHTTNPSSPPAPSADNALSGNGASNPAVKPTSSPAAESTATAVIGPKIRVKGELVGEEDILVQGQVDGLVDLKNHTLTIGEQGIVNANVLAKTITIEGTVEGDLFGQERISILSSSNVKGNLVADRVILEDGAKFRGSIDMDVEAHRERFEKLTNHAPKSEKPNNKPPANAATNTDKKD